MSAGLPSNENARQIVHMTMGGFAFLLAYLAWWQAAIAAAAALAFNAFVLPRIGGTRLYRTVDVVRGYPAGILLYPLSVLLLILIFRRRLDIAAAAWGILAVGDAMATLVGRRLDGPRVPWNREKTWAGSAALFVSGSAAGAVLAWWCSSTLEFPSSPWFWSLAPLIAAGVAAAVETIPVRLDDNLSVPAAAAATLWACSLASVEVMSSVWLAVLWTAPVAIGLNVLVAWGGHRVRSVSDSGAICGALIGTVVFIGVGWQGWLLLVATFLAATVSSRVGLRHKTLLGIAEERGGRRGAGNAIANTGVAASASVIALVSESQPAALLAFAAALAAGGSDTIASEIGKAWGRHAYLVPTLRRVAPGTSGAVSLEGTAAGLIGAVVLGLLAVALAIVPRELLPAVVAGATIGSFVESGLGATLEGPGILNNDLLNFLNTAVAAAATVLIAGAMG